MKIDKRKFLLAISVVAICALMSSGAGGESLSLSGKVSDTAAHAVPSATVSARRMRDGKVFTSRSSGDGDYIIPDLEPGDYQVWAKAGELRAQKMKVTLAAGQTTDIVVSPGTRPVK